MLTHNDQTVKDALETFRSVKDLPVQDWGFKNIGLPVPQMKELVAEMKAAQKTTYLEVVTYTEHECAEAAKLAVECKFDKLCGTKYFPSVMDAVNDKIDYYPFCGKVWGNPSVLGGEIDEIIEHANELHTMGAKGCDLLAYRYTGDAEKLLRIYLEKVHTPTIVAGSIGSYQRLDLMCALNPYAITMGSALFTRNFEKEGSFRDNLAKVVDYLDSK